MTCNPNKSTGYSVLSSKLTILAATVVGVVIVTAGCNSDTRSTQSARPPNAAAQAPDKSSSDPTTSQPPSKLDAQTVSETSSEGPSATEVDPPADPAAVPAPVDGQKSAVPELTGELTMPLVALTQQHADTCRVVVGGTLPTATVRDLEGKEHPLAAFYGAKYTVVVFWNLGDRLAGEELDDLGPLVAAPYAAKGVKVVAVCAGGTAEAVQSQFPKDSIKHPIVLDTDGAALGLVATDSPRLMPRTYLIDSTGKVLWFDIEYSRTTRRDLHQALRFLMKQ